VYWDVTLSAPLSQGQWPDRGGHLGGVLVSLGASLPHYYLFNLLLFLLFLFCRIINKPKGTWRSGGADGNLICVLRGIRHIIVGEEQRGVAKVACLRTCRYGLRVEFSPRHRGEVHSDWTSKCDPTVSEETK